MASHYDTYIKSKVADPVPSDEEVAELDKILDDLYEIDISIYWLRRMPHEFFLNGDDIFRIPEGKLIAVVELPFYDSVSFIPRDEFVVPPKNKRHELILCTEKMPILIYRPELLEKLRTVKTAIDMGIETEKYPLLVKDEQEAIEELLTRLSELGLDWVQRLPAEYFLPSDELQCFLRSPSLNGIRPAMDFIMPPDYNELGTATADLFNPREDVEVDPISFRVLLEGKPIVICKPGLQVLLQEMISSLGKNQS